MSDATRRTRARAARAAQDPAERERVAAETLRAAGFWTAGAQGASVGGHKTVQIVCQRCGTERRAKVQDLAKGSRPPCGACARTAAGEEPRPVGRPRVAAEGQGAVLYVRASAAQVALLDELDAGKGRADVVRRLLDAIGTDRELRGAVERALSSRP